LVIWDGHDPVLGQIAGELQQRIPTELWIIPPEA
jgi:hypothetical protein